MSETILFSSKVFKLQREGFIAKLSTIGDINDDLNDIKDAMADGAPDENRAAVIIYLNAMINGSGKIFRLLEYVCGKYLFAKLVKSGLIQV